MLILKSLTRLIMTAAVMAAVAAVVFYALTGRVPFITKEQSMREDFDVGE